MRLGSMITRKHSLNDNFHWMLKHPFFLSVPKTASIAATFVRHCMFLVIDYSLGGISMSVFGQFVVQDLGIHVCVIFTDLKTLTSAL